MRGAVRSGALELNSELLTFPVALPSLPEAKESLVLHFSSSGWCHGPCIWTPMVHANASSCHVMILKPLFFCVPCSNFLNTGLSLTTNPVVLASPLTGISLKSWALPSFSYTFFPWSPESSGCDFSTAHALVSLWPLFLLIRMPPPPSSSWWGLPFLWGSFESLPLLRSLSHPYPYVASTFLCFPCSLCIAFLFLIPSLKENWACHFLVSLPNKNEFPGGSCHFYLIHRIFYSHPA